MRALPGKRDVSEFQNKNKQKDRFSEHEVKILATLHVVGPRWSSNHNRKMPGIMRLLEVMKKEAWFLKLLLRLSPKAKAGKLKHPRNRSGEKASVPH